MTKYNLCVFVLKCSLYLYANRIETSISFLNLTSACIKMSIFTSTPRRLINKNEKKINNVLEVNMESEYSVNLLKNLNMQYNENILCDLCLVAIDGTK